MYNYIATRQDPVLFINGVLSKRDQMHLRPWGS